MIEFASTSLINLIDKRFRATIDRNTPYEHAFEHLYWQAAGKDHLTGEKSTLLRNFEKRYKADFLRFMEFYNTRNLHARYHALPEADRKNPALVAALRHYDHTVNIRWVMAHLNAARKYLGDAEATGGSHWQKYMHPRYQRRIFFPELWSEEELANWDAMEVSGNHHHLQPVFSGCNSPGNTGCTAHRLESSCTGRNRFQTCAADQLSRCRRQ